MRIKRRMLRESYVGGLYTLRHARGGGIDTRQTMGVDFGWRRPRFADRRI